MLFRAAWKIALLFFVALTPMVAPAQQTGATVRGVVADPENAVIPGATVTLTPGQSLTMDVQMAIQQQQQEVNVTAQAAQVSVDADSNASSTVLKGKDLDALSDDPAELSSELTALAGPGAGGSRRR